MMLVNLVIVIQVNLVILVTLVNVVILMILVTMTHCQDHILTENIRLYGPKYHILETRGGVIRRDDEQRQIRKDRATQLLSCRKADFRNNRSLVMMMVNEDDDPDDDDDNDDDDADDDDADGE